MGKEWDWEWKESFLDIPTQEWNALVPEANPFLRLEFFQILERSGSIGEKTPWHPFPLLVYLENHLVGAIPLFLRWDSYGEYIFDFEWVHLYHKLQLPYYPKLQSAIPFTPVTTPKILVSSEVSRNDWIQNTIPEILKESQDRKLSSCHILFHTEEEVPIWKGFQFSHRITFQYHWFNRGYKSFDEYLMALRKEKRKTIRKERASIHDQGIRIEVLTGDSLQPNLGNLMYQFYSHTHVKKWGRPYLTKKFFEILFQEYRKNILLVLAYYQKEPIAGSLNFLSDTTIYGRYWGCKVEIPFLHFECCYYQLIEYAIQNHFEKIEAGAQGEHKFLRGFEAVPIHSSHFFFNPKIHQFLQESIQLENMQNESAIRNLNLISPIKQLRNPTQTH